MKVVQTGDTRKLLLTQTARQMNFFCLAQGVNNPVCGVNGASAQKKGHTVSPFPCDGYERHA